jgi:hypothetical protein
MFQQFLTLHSSLKLLLYIHSDTMTEDSNVQNIKETLMLYGS